MVFRCCRKCGNFLVILEHFLLSWRAALTKQEGINESALISLRKVTEKSWNFTSGPQWEPCSHRLLLFLIVCLCTVCFSPSPQTLYPNLIPPDATYLMAITDHNISPLLSLPRPSMRALLTRMGLHGNCDQAHGCLDTGIVRWGEVLMPGRICLLTATETQLTLQ